MSDGVDRFHDLLDGVVDVDVIVKTVLDDDVDVLIDRSGEHRSAVDAVVVGKVGAAAEEAEAQGSLSDDHAAIPKVAGSWDTTAMIKAIRGFRGGMVRRYAARPRRGRRSCRR